MGLFILTLIGSGLLGLVSASLALHAGMRSAERLPGESRWPHCLYCFKPLQALALVPLIGWLARPAFQTLPCPCGARRGLWFQPVVELTGFALGIAAACSVPAEWSLAPLCIGLGLLPAIAAIDLAFGIIPDGLNFALGLCGLLWTLAHGDLYMALVTAGALLALGLFLALVYSKWRKRDMLGLGDVKFFTAAGLWLPIMIAPWFLGVAGILGILFSLVWRHTVGEREFPFAPALCVSLAGCVFAHIYLEAFTF